MIGKDDFDIKLVKETLTVAPFVPLDPDTTQRLLSIDGPLSLFAASTVGKQDIGEFWDKIISILNDDHSSVAMKARCVHLSVALNDASGQAIPDCHPLKSLILQKRQDLNDIEDSEENLLLVLTALYRYILSPRYGFPFSASRLFELRNKMEPRLYSLLNSLSSAIKTNIKYYGEFKIITFLQPSLSVEERLDLIWNPRAAVSSLLLTCLRCGDFEAAEELASVCNLNKDFTGYFSDLFAISSQTFSFGLSPQNMSTGRMLEH